MASALFKNLRPRHLIAAFKPGPAARQASATASNPDRSTSAGFLLPATSIKAPNGAAQLIMRRVGPFFSRGELPGNSSRWLTFCRAMVMLLSIMALLVLGSTHAQAQVIYVSTSAAPNGGIAPAGGTLNVGINYTVKSEMVPDGDTVTIVRLMEGTEVLHTQFYSPKFEHGGEYLLNIQRKNTAFANLGVGFHEVYLRSTTYYGQQTDSPSHYVYIATQQEALLPQSITFPAISNTTIDSGAFTVSATASSGLPVSFISADTAVCTIAGSTVTLVSTGTCTIAANQSGNDAYAAASDVTQSFQITRTVQSTLTNPDRLLAGESLLPGEYIESPNGAAQLLMRYDGNLVLYRLEDDYPVWNTNSVDHPQAYTVLQSDGNLVVYSPDGQTPLFNTGTFTPGTALVLQADENLVLVPPDHPGMASSMRAATGTGGILWASNTSVPNPPEPDDLDADRLPLDPGPEVPSTDQNACIQDGQFWQVDGTGDSSNGLVNRHVLCVKQKLTRYIDLFDNGIPAWNAGILTLEALWSVHGVHSVLEKRGTLTLRYSYTPLDEHAAPPLNVIAKISCSPQGSDAPINCDRQMPIATLTNGGQTTNEVVIPLIWDTSIGKITTAMIGVKLLYTTDGTMPVETPDGSGSTESLSPKFASWPIRCDIDQLRLGWKGCVFPEASAVWVADKSPATQYARQHIADVFEKMQHIPGRFEMALESRSQAKTGGQNDPLTRTGPAGNKLNRQAIRALCASIASPGPNHDCDEYPFASSEEGANGKSLSQYSVRKIPHWDNRKAGAQLGAMYAKERLLVGDKFWVKVD
jgi:hypothetical protein